MEETTLRIIPIHRSLHRPNMLLGAEADLVFAAGMISFLVAFSATKLLNISAGVIFWTFAVFLFRVMAKKDPILSKVWRRHVNQEKVYPARSTPWSNPRSIRFDPVRKKQKGLPELLQYATCIDDGVILLKNGSFLAGFRYESLDAASSTPDELGALSAQANNAFKQLGDGWMIQVDAVRRPTGKYSAPGASHFPDPLSKAIDDERRAIFENEGNLYATENILYVTYKPSLTAEKLAGFAYTNNSGEKKEVKPSDAEKSLARFKETLGQIEDGLSISMRIERLRDFSEVDEHGQAHVYSSLLSYIQHAVTGEKHPVILPSIPMYLDCLVGGQDLVGGIHPKIGGKHIAVVAIDGFPQESWPMMLDILDGMPLSYRFSSRFVCMDQFTALNEINKYRKTWAQKTHKLFDVLFNNQNARVNRDAVSMHEDAENAFQEVQSGFVTAGYYSAGIVIMHEDRETLEDWCREISKLLGKRGLQARMETINCVEAWLGSHPGNGYSNLRQVLINSLNFVDLLPLSSIWAGREHSPCPFYPPDSPPLFHAATEGYTPFRYQLHYGDVGHTLVFGPTGAGKSTLLAHMAIQFRRYPNARIFAFDKGLSLFPGASGVRGTHYDIAADDSDLAFCPLRHVNSDAEQSWSEEWLATLCEMQGVTITPKHRVALHDAMGQIRHSPPNMRSLSHYYHYLQNQHLKEALKHYTKLGSMGRLLDAESDNMGFSTFTVFEIEHLMNLGDKNLIPVLLYIFHRIEKALTGHPAMLIIDEAWIALAHPVFREKIREWLKVLRKANCAVVLATQSLSDARASGLMDVLVESCPKQIFLANITARQEVQVEMYQSLGLNNRQIQIIASAQPKRDYYVVSPEGRRLINLALGPLELAFVGASGKEDIARIKELQKLHGAKWPQVWAGEQTGKHYDFIKAA